MYRRCFPVKCESDYTPAQEQTQTVGRGKVGVGVGGGGGCNDTILLVLTFIAISWREPGVWRTEVALLQQ